MGVAVKAIGTIRSPFKEKEGMPVQPRGAADVSGTVEVFTEYVEGLKDLAGFSHVILIYHFHKSDGYNLTVTPFLDTEKRGLFSTRAPRRPNPIGLSVVRLLSVEKNILNVEGIDVLDGTPLLDIKPFVPFFDIPEGRILSGWLEKKEDSVVEKKSDDRFT